MAPGQISDEGNETSKPYLLSSVGRDGLAEWRSSIMKNGHLKKQLEGKAGDAQLDCSADSK